MAQIPKKRLSWYFRRPGSQSSPITDTQKSPDRPACSNRPICPCSRCFALQNMVSPIKAHQPQSVDLVYEHEAPRLYQNLRKLKPGRAVQHSSSSGRSHKSPNASTSSLLLNAEWTGRDARDTDRSSLQSTNGSHLSGMPGVAGSDPKGEREIHVNL